MILNLVTQNVRENAVQSFTDELHRNITDENPTTHSDDTVNNMDMADTLIGDVSDREINDTIDVMDQVSLLLANSGPYQTLKLKSV